MIIPVVCQIATNPVNSKNVAEQVAASPMRVAFDPPAVELYVRQKYNHLKHYVS
ncbi:MAG: hypothetical protein ACI8UZ_000376 [Akkermansiaceae bacterium]|jgi:hypothetical protein